MIMIKSWKKASKLLNENKIGIIPTDTIFGISCSALNKKNVENIYKLKKRDYDKPFIILISDINDLKKFTIILNDFQLNTCKKYWPGPVSIILPIENEDLLYLHRGKNSLAFRLPNYKKLLQLLTNTGPLVSTSANISNFSAVGNVQQAAEIFKDKIDFYLDDITKSSAPSKIISLLSNKEVIIR